MTRRTGRSLPPPRRVANRRKNQIRVPPGCITVQALRTRPRPSNTSSGRLGALAVTRNLTRTSNGARRDQSPAAPSNPAIEAHFTALIRVALLRRSCARPFATHACHTASSSGVAAGGDHVSCGPRSSTEVDISDLLSAAVSGRVLVRGISAPGRATSSYCLGDLRGE